ncbi:HAMP domain-containing histidine kinase [Campylobacter sp. faydin G-105]|uniref:sensor histidine kinase n=1 Tax=Campylobacter anatolicus TaxID=2829105 RepID=UPI001B91DB94|nr:HAMP domain-containing sensor histidine kinase [Campylobacter anatolicus]MBR8462437.1 HAMP domain-containing histidine kinase [Campylobacter anatolicus]
MLNRHHILPIFLLYFLTSIAFLGFFGTLFYERGKNFIMEKDAFELREIRRDLQMRLHENGILSKDDFAELNAYALNLKTGEVIKNDFTPNKNTRRYVENDDIIEQFVLYRPHHMMGGKMSHMSGQRSGKDGGSEYMIAIKRGVQNEKLFTLKMQILAVSAIILAVILIIAYFIIRLSLRPLYEKVEFLDGFLRDTTHEINTPLSVILMSVELFEGDPKKYLNNIKTAANTLSNLHSDLVALKFNQTVNDKNEAINLADMLDERIEYFSLSMEQKKISLNTSLDDIYIKASKTKLQKIIDNLLNNAVKYCNEGGEISINLDKNELIIANSGDMIASENLDKIFDLYTRFDSQNGGFGVGLHIVKKYCDEQEIKISCQSDASKTRFYLTFDNILETQK